MNPLDLDPLWLAAAAVAVVAVLLLTIWIWLRHARRPRHREAAGVLVDVSVLDSSGPPPSGPRLEFYGTPVRLAVVVVAPAGRGSELPQPDVLPGLMERLVPGMTHVIAAHKPLIYRWPVQLSSQGFSQSFFNQVALPGARGKGTPWCSIAGKLQIGDRSFLVGLAFSAGTPNSVSQVVVQHEGQWLDILRYRDE